MPAKKTSEPEPVASSFEEAAEELEQITRRLEREPDSLENLLKDFERGQALLSYCQSTLKSARGRLDMVEASLQTETPEDDETQDSLTEGETANDDDVRLF